VLEVPSGRVIASGLSMPHSPRFHNGRLWVLNSGTGEFGSIDLESGAFQSLSRRSKLIESTGRHPEPCPEGSPLPVKSLKDLFQPADHISRAFALLKLRTMV
jgi:hypothetical protein